MQRLTLISHTLCPYVQRVAIALAEKSLDFERIDVDLSDKPEWFKTLSPLSKTPVLKVGEVAIFESAVILEYLEDTCDPRLHPADPLRRAEHRGWIEYASSLLNDIAAFYAANAEEAFAARASVLRAKFCRLEDLPRIGPYFERERFSLVDAVFASVFRYFDTFDKLGEFGILADMPVLAAWRKILALRPSVAAAVVPDYPDRLLRFLAAKPSVLGDRARAWLSRGNSRESAGVEGKFATA